ncbi:MAG: DNA-processing protein DprA [Acidobacteria bacterium]|nr:DNA-processing protein DprA [Acidobacteriota bacterium]
MQTASDTIIKNAVEWTLIPGIGIRVQNRIWKIIGDIADLFTMGEGALKSLCLPDEAYRAIQSRTFRAAAEEIFDWACSQDCRFLVRGTAGYPSLLEEIYDAPLVLYARGRLEQPDTPRIAVVGSRRPTVYGLQAAHDIAQDLGSRGIGIVSGLARGIDAAAHRGCMEGGGYTIAVLGCGIDVDYPPEHRQLKEQILRTGLVLSEYPPATQPVPHNFPVRNRIISGLSLGAVIVEASEKSGSLITARLAMEQNREVFAVPGNITSPVSYGPNFLIKQGAKLVQSYRDVIDEMPGVLQEKIYSREKAYSSRCLKLNLVSEEEKRLLLFLKLDEATHFDKLYHYGDMDIGDLSERLINLELEGWIRRLPGNMYIRAKRFPDE